MNSLQRWLLKRRAERLIRKLDEATYRCYKGLAEQRREELKKMCEGRR